MKNITLFLILVVGMMSLSGCIRENQQGITTSTSVPVETTTSLTSPTTLLITSTTIIPQPIDCKKIHDVDKRVDCIRNIVELTGDTSLCNNFTGVDRDDCLRAIAEGTRNISLCDTLSSYFDKRMCYSYIAFKENNVSLCGNIPDYDIYYPSYGRDSCYEYFAMGTGDARVCKIINETRRVNFCYSDVAEYTNNLSLCDEIEDGYIEKFMCLDYFDEQKNISIPEKYKQCNSDEDCTLPRVCFPNECINRNFFNITGELLCPSVCGMCCLNKCECKCIKNNCTLFVYSKT